MADSYLSKTPSASNRRTMTFSVWVKRNQLSHGMIYTANAGNGYFIFDSDNTLHYRSWNGSSYDFLMITNRKFSDLTSWHHIVVAQDTTQATDTNRIKIYVNGTLITSFATATYPSQNHDGYFNSNVEHTIGKGNDGGVKYFDGQMAHFHFIDGTAYAASDFGETDSTTGEWKPKLTPSVTYGTNGFFLKFENSGALGTDSSGNTNTYTVNGSLKQSISTPSNLFCTLDSNQTNTATDVQHAGTSLYGRNAGSTLGANGTLCMKKGKWYWEVKVETDRTTADGATIGVYKANSAASIRWKNTGASAIVGKETGAYLGNQGMTYQPTTSTPNIISDGDSGTVNYGSQCSANDIIMVALDLDNGKWWLGKNGTWFNAPATSNAGVPNTGANAGISFVVDGDYWGVNVTSVTSAADDGSHKYMFCNFGEGRFGTTAVASGNADDAGQGTFEYDVPAGFYAICTRNIKDYG